MKILIIGASGFIGKSLVDYLQNFNHEVCGFDLIGTDSLTHERLKQFYCGSIQSISSVVKKEDKFDVIVYLAASVSSLATFKGDQKLLTEEFTNATSVIDFSRERGVKKFIYLSSGGTIYGSRNQPPFLESMPPSPNSLYALSKNLLENYFIAYLGQLSIKTINLRLSNPFGFHQKTSGSQGVIPIFIRRILNRELIEVRNFNAVRDYIYIDDVCRAIMKSISYGGNIINFNIGSGVGITTKDLIYKIESLANIEALYKEVNSSQTDLDASYLNINLAKKELVWEPQINFDEGLFRVYKNIEKMRCK